MAHLPFQETIPSRVEEIIRVHIGEDVELTPETDLLNELAIDSLELVELGVKIEKQLGKKLPAADLRDCITVGELTRLAQRIADEQ